MRPSGATRRALQDEGSDRWDAEYEAEVQSSRLETTRTLRDAIIRARSPPHAWVLLTGVGYYRPSLSQEYNEESAGGDFEFMSRLVRDWEGAARLPEETGRSVRQVVVRSGVVLGKNGGALKWMLWPFRLGLGGSLGSGRQPFPWIHVDDLSGILLHAMEGSTVHGILNGVAPCLSTNAEFVGTLARCLGRPALLPVPGGVLQALLGPQRASMLLEGQWVVPQRTLESGYRYHFPQLAAALKDLVS
ncbi:epimerase family protein SDR39U1 isoform X2 [Narcine bancroftii]|uniref:epimerase family protein SDR39U1 isoform X2 n=1 Tax=Narcine bancroftii TaxID=1343680 RepID=UPI0038322077